MTGEAVHNNLQKMSQLTRHPVWIFGVDLKILFFTSEAEDMVGTNMRNNLCAELLHSKSKVMPISIPDGSCCHPGLPIVIEDHREYHSEQAA